MRISAPGQQRLVFLEEFQERFKTPSGLLAKAVPARRGEPLRGLGRQIRKNDQSREWKEHDMPKFVIERDIPGAGNMSAEDLKMISQKSCGVLSSLGPSVQWVHSYVTADKIYCLYQAADESLVRRHAELGGFPANKISKVASVIDPSTAE
jgi:hypothetical protein